MDEPSVQDLLTVQQAMELIDAIPIELHPRARPLAQLGGMYLAQDVRCDRDVPAFDKSLMDGWAVRSMDVATTPCTLTIAGRVHAGEEFNGTLEPGQTVAIMTGAPIPIGANAVVPIEQTDVRADSNSVLFNRIAKAGQFIQPRGREAKAGDVVLKAGQRMGPAQIAVAAALGISEPLVYTQPFVSILGTGDELVEIHQSPQPTQIRSSNNAMLVSLIRRLGYEAVKDLGIVPDDRDKIRQAIEGAMQFKVLLVTGGMSMGERDYVPRILQELGGELLITKLRIKPGKPFILAKMPKGRYVCGLPGNPLSAFVCTITLVRRLLDRLSGAPKPRESLHAPLAVDLDANGPRQFYQPAIYENGQVSPLNWNGSADIFTLAAANCLIIRPENQPPMTRGTPIEFMEI